MSGYSSSSDSDSSYDDDFLTRNDTSGAGGGPPTAEEREAMVRKKLLQSFYGAAGTGESKDDNAGEDVVPKDNDGGGADDPEEEEEKDDFDDDLKQDAVKDLLHRDNDNEDEGKKGSRSKADMLVGGSADLDSPNFDPYRYTRNLLLSSSTETLLMENEKLATEIRALDSTMQTLVYENYSKFIDATDAIRSIGRSVDASENGLRRLAKGMEHIETASTSVDSALKHPREAVAEKLTVKRHLSRLDALLKLPNTLRSQIQTGRFKLAAISHKGAAHILAKHSIGFESLSRIESECNAIMEEMESDLKLKLSTWSGGGNVEFSDDEEEEEIDYKEKPIPDPPTNVAEIYECAGALIDLLDGKGRNREEKAARYKSLALTSCSRLLEEKLESHQNKKKSTHRILSAGSTIVPHDFLDGLLEAATLYGFAFGPSSTTNDKHLLGEFVTNLFDSFLSSARRTLVDRSNKHNNDKDDDKDDDDEAQVVEEKAFKSLSPFANDDDDSTTPSSPSNEFAKISYDLTLLIRSVRELASGLALPEVGLEYDIASGLVDQISEMAELLVQRQVSVHFHDLKLRTIDKCIAPFAKNAISTNTQADGIANLVSVMMEDIVQTTDEAIVNIAEMLSSTPVDPAMLNQTVHNNSRRFALWLASTFEIVAGCDTGGGDHAVLLDVSNEDTEWDDDDEIDNHDFISGEGKQSFNDMELMSELSFTDDEKRDPLQDLLLLLDENDDNDTTVDSTLDDNEDVHPTKQPKAHLTLAIAEACRIAQDQIMESINQSIASLLLNNIPTSTNNDHFTTAQVVTRFQLAASRVLSLYATNRGADAALIAYENHISSSWMIETSMEPFEPRPISAQILEIVKVCSLDCAAVFGGETRAAPVPPFGDASTNNMSHPNYNFGSNLGGTNNLRGLQLDVERMFSEKTLIYSSNVEFTRDSVIVSVFKIALKAMVEYSRTKLFSKYGYQQVQIDVEMIRHMIPHYVDMGLAGTLHNLLDDVMISVGERCLEKEPLEEGIPSMFVRRYFEDHEDILESFVITEKGDEQFE